MCGTYSEMRYPEFCFTAVRRSPQPPLCFTASAIVVLARISTPTLHQPLVSWSWVNRVLIAPRGERRRTLPTAPMYHKVLYSLYVKRRRNLDCNATVHHCERSPFHLRFKHCTSGCALVAATPVLACTFAPNKDGYGSWECTQILRKGDHFHTTVRLFSQNVFGPKSAFWIREYLPLDGEIAGASQFRPYSFP